jgi:hypothetical protein
MAQHLCIVARDKPLLLGYLNIVLEQLSATGDELQIVIDRRPDSIQVPNPVSPPSAMVSDQRRVHGVDELLRNQGYAIVSREDGMSWLLSDPGGQALEELVPVDELADEDVPRAPGRRRVILSALAIVATVVGMVVVIPRDSVYRLGDGLVGVADRGTSWLRGSVDLPRTASSTAPVTNGTTTAARQPMSAPGAATNTPLPASVAVFQSARAAERTEITALPPGGTRRFGDPARATEPARAAGPTRAMETPRKVEPQRKVEPKRAAESARKVEPTRAVEPVRAVVAARAAGPPGPAETPRATTPPPTAEAAATPAARADLPARRGAARVESAMPPKNDAASEATPKPAEFTGMPRFEMSRERDASGRTAAITVRVTDTAGRPLPSADVRILRQFTDGAVRETQLEAITPVGSYRGALPNSGPNTDGLVMRILLGDRRFEVPLAE